MSFDWPDYLSLARELAQHPGSPGPEEASLRSAMSRAYYAAFCAARNFARDHDNFQLTHTGADHWNVKEHFRSSSDRARKSIGYTLDLLRNRRNMADYNDSITDDIGAQAQSSIIRAEDILKRLGELSE